MEGDRFSPTRIVATAAPAAGAVAVFGSIYGATAEPLLGTSLTLLSSALIFSGALQFAIVGLVSAGAGASALLMTGMTLNLRHVVLGAILRRRLKAAPVRRAGLAWFLLDESFGLALAAQENTEKTLFVSGVLLYLAWQVGTLAGVLGGDLPGLDDVATAIFPVLFIGLASLAATKSDHVWRAVTSAGLTAVAAFLVPDLRALAPVIAAVAVALPGDAE